MHKQVILIMTDTTRYDMLGCCSDSLRHTPHLDALADRGVLFSGAYTTAPVCAPARGALFTGMYSHLNGVTSNSLALRQGVTHIGQRVGAHGIAAGYIGKWHLDGGDYFGDGICPDGFDPEYWYDMRAYLNELSEDERIASRRKGAQHQAEETFGYRVTDRACRFLQDKAEQDFLLVVSYDEPHDPSQCPDAFRALFEDGELPYRTSWDDHLEGKPQHQRTWSGAKADLPDGAWSPWYRDLLACNAFIDSQIGRVLEAAKAAAPDAMVIFTSDHGDFLGEHRLLAKGPAAYESIAHIPLIISAPGLAPCVNRQLASHIDIVPTLLEWYGLPLAQTLQGVSLMPALKDPECAVRPAVYIEFERYGCYHDGFGGFQPMRAVYDGRYKLVLNLLSGDELYDLVSDPDEMQNLIDARALEETRCRLHDRLLDWMNETCDPLRGYYWLHRPWRRDAAQSSWAFTGQRRAIPREGDMPPTLDYSTGLPMPEDGIDESGRGG